MSYCKNLYHYERRRSRVVTLGSLKMGGQYPIRIQSTLTADTMDTQACVAQTLKLVDLGCEIVRITAPTVRDAMNLKNIHRALRSEGCHVPLVADIHFKPQAALEAAKWVEKVRINPGNFADAKKFQVREYSDLEYEEELQRVREAFKPLLQQCRENGVALRIGTNHGSLSDRIMNRFGDSPLGMVESALEFARIAREDNYHNFVFSMKASNPKIMIAAYRLLLDRLNEEGEDWNYPIHLGVTEAGDGEDGRIKSALGIGSLLADGIGDTIRVSLTEDSEHEIPVAKQLLEYIEVQYSSTSPSLLAEDRPSWPLFQYQRRHSSKMRIDDLDLGGDALLRVVLPRTLHGKIVLPSKHLGECQPELVLEDLPLREIDPRHQEEFAALEAENKLQLITVRDGLKIAPIAAFRLLAARLPVRYPILLKDTLEIGDSKSSACHEMDHLLASSIVIGSLLCDGIGDAILLRREHTAERSLRLAYHILQAAGARLFKTDYVACPSCGRTLFNLQETTARIKKATGHLKGLRLAVMGCIVNGPGEMADADFGYVGGAPGKINLYVGKRAVKFNIPQEKAVDELISLIKEHGRWVDLPSLSSEEI